MMIRIFNVARFIKIVLVLMALMGISACGGSASNSGGESALSCVSSESATNGIAIMNTCNQAINVLSDDGERLNIAAGNTSILTNATGNTAVAACFAPSVPEDLNGGSFTCS